MVQLSSLGEVMETAVDLNDQLSRRDEEVGEMDAHTSLPIRGEDSWLHDDTGDSSGNQSEQHSGVGDRTRWPSWEAL